MMGSVFGFRAAPTNAASTRFELWGDITEDDALTQFFRGLKGTVLLDLAGVRRFTSGGIRQWVRALRAADDAGVRLTFERCSDAVVHHLNTIVDFQGRAKITSVMAPYLCPADRTEHFAEIPLAQPNPRALLELEQERPCPQCGKPLLFDDDPESYLSFLNQAPPSPE